MTRPAYSSPTFHVLLNNCYETGILPCFLGNVAVVLMSARSHLVSSVHSPTTTAWIRRLRNAGLSTRIMISLSSGIATEHGCSAACRQRVTNTTFLSLLQFLDPYFVCFVFRNTHRNIDETVRLIGTITTISPGSCHIQAEFTRQLSPCRDYLRVPFTIYCWKLYPTTVPAKFAVICRFVWEQWKLSCRSA